MAVKQKTTDSDVTRLRINRLAGRMLRLKNALHRQEILLVYDLHMDLESVRPLAKKLSRYGSVTAADLPGFGGMDSFYKIKRKPTIDNYCAYLASFIKLRYKSRRLTIVGLGVGGTIAVQTLQKYPDIAAKTNRVLLFGSLVDKSDRSQKVFTRKFSTVGYRLLLLRPISWMGRTVIMRGPFLRVALGLSDLQSAPLSKKDFAEQDRLWRGDDVRSHLFLQKELAALRMPLARLDTPAYALAINTPPDFDYSTWQEHLKIVFTDVVVAHSQRKVQVLPKEFFEQLSTEAKKFLRQ